MSLMPDSPDRARMEAALRHQKHDRVPAIEFHIDPVNMLYLAGGEIDYPHLLTTLGTVPSEKHFAVCERLGFDLVPFCATAPYYEIPRASEAGNFKIGGLNAREDVERLVLDKPPIEEIVRLARETIARADRRNMGVYPFVLSPFSSVYLSMGIDRFWLKTVEDPQLVEEAFDRATDYVADLMEALCELDFAMIYLGDDIAINNGLLLSPQRMRELWMPRMRRVVAPAHARRKPIVFHSCGNWTDIFPMADELGFAGIEPLQPQCNDIYQIKKDWGERFCLIGNIDIAGVLAFGTPEEVRRDVREHIDGLAGDGGYVVHSGHSIVDAIPPQNCLAMFDEARRYGRYS